MLVLLDQQSVLALMVGAVQIVGLAINMSLAHIVLAMVVVTHKAAKVVVYLEAH